MHTTPAQSTEAIIMNRSLWGGRLHLLISRPFMIATQLGQLTHARQLEKQFFFITNRYAKPEFHELYYSIDELLIAGWRII